MADRETTHLEIVLDGRVPGLPEHRLSFDAFGRAFTNLLSALRRIASGLVKDALGEDYGAMGGRYSKEGESIDLLLSSLSGGSPTSVGFEVVQGHEPASGRLPFGHLTDRTVDFFLTALEEESQGREYSYPVRKYLGALPAGIVSQSYLLHEQSGRARQVSIGDYILAEEPSPDLPYLVEVTGAVVGVGWEPGRVEVRIQGPDRQLNCSATAEQVERAYNLRSADVRALMVRDGSTLRLVDLRPSDAPRFEPSETDIEEQIFRRWHELMKRLAE